MCTICASLRPRDPLATTDNHLTDTHLTSGWDIEMFAGGADLGSTSGPTRAPFTLTQIANQLTDGYWNANFEQFRAFDLDASRTLTVDLSGLELGAVRTIARMALEAWSDVTGITFVERTVRTESGDAAANTNSTARMSVGEIFNGTLNAGTDQDYVRVRLTAGQTYVIEQQSVGGNGLDSYLRLRNAQGTLLSEDDDGGAVGTDSQIVFTANTTGYYYIDAGSFDDVTSGAYQLFVARSGASGVDITFDDEDTGAYSTSELDGNTILSSFINLQQGWDPDAISMNSYWFQTMVHEIGHALGLGHAGNYNGSATWGVNNDYDNDSWQATIMSYFAQGDGAGVGQGGFTGDSVNPNIGASYAYLATLMPADIIAIQNLYGTNVSTRGGNTVYGANSNVGGYYGQLMDQAFGNAAATERVFIDNPVALTVYDTGGRDALDFSTFGANQRINLNAGSLSNVAGLRENLQIARGVVIEDAIGGRGNDLLTGNTRGNILIGNAGADTLTGGDGADTLNGGTGRDRLEGGSGADMASYVRAAARVTVDLQNNAQNAGEAAGDVLVSVGGIRGSDFGDRLSGNEHGNTLQGQDGRDYLWGRAGNDAISGGIGTDTVAGGVGNDTMWGGTGADQLVFNDGADRIRDFTNNVDTLVLDRDLWGGGNRTVTRILNDFAVDVGSAVVLYFGSGNNIRLDGIASINALADDIAFI
jgi:Peptidase M10 serralysin C terminal/Bacterial pre-peptidase C-terminal domain/Metallo-peptidase family M12B Reprolysin-like